MSSDAGFTLSEVLVALALLALTAALLAGSASSARRVLGISERNSADHAVIAAESYLRAALEHVQSGDSETSGPVGGLPAFAGDATALSFTTSHTPRGLLEGLYRVEVRLEPAAARSGVSYLFITQALLRRGGDSGAAAETRLNSRLVKNVAAVAFTYFGGSEEDPDQLAWRSDWRSPPAPLPRLVRISVRFSRGDTRTWRDLQIPLNLAR